MDTRVREVLAIAEQQLKTQQFQEAVESFEIARKLCPQLSRIYCRLGIALIGLEQAPEAARMLRAAIRKHPKDIALYLHLGNAYLLCKEDDMAKDIFLKTLELFPVGFNRARGSIHNHLGDIYFGEQKMAKAECHYEEAIILHPRLAQALNSLGAIHFLAKRYDDAIVCFERAFRSRPSMAEAVYNLASAHEVIGNRELSRLYYKHLFTARPHLVTCPSEMIN
jgi:tetratricopeptide (TPR) repeat protein